MLTMREDLASLGEDIKEEDFVTILIGSLPKTYDTYLSAIMATMNVLGRALDPDALLQCVEDEYDCRAIANGVYQLHTHRAKANSCRRRKDLQRYRKR